MTNEEVAACFPGAELDEDDGGEFVRLPSNEAVYFGGDPGAWWLETRAGGDVVFSVEKQPDIDTARAALAKRIRKYADEVCAELTEGLA